MTLLALTGLAQGYVLTSQRWKAERLLKVPEFKKNISNT